MNLEQAVWWAQPPSTPLSLPTTAPTPPPGASPALTCPTCHFKSQRLPALLLPPQPGCLSVSWGRGGGTGPASWVLRLCSWFWCHGTGQAAGRKLGKSLGRGVLTKPW